MQSTLTTILTAAVRALLQLLSGWLIAKGVLKPEDDFSSNLELIGGIVTALITLGWMVKVKVDERRKLNTAAVMEKTTLDAVAEKVKAGEFAPALTPTNQVPVIQSTGDGVDPKRFISGVVLALAVGGSVAAGCAAFAKNPTPEQQASAKQQTADVIARLTTAKLLAASVTQSLVTSSLSPQLKIEIGCDVMKAVGRDQPTATITKECGPLPTRDQSPLQLAADTAEKVATCASRQNTIAVAFQVTRPLWEKLEASTERALQIAGAAIRLAMVPIPTTCGGVS